MKRGAIIAIDTLIQLGIILIVFLIVFLGLFPGVERKLEAAEEKGKCEWSVMLAAVRKGGSLSIAEGVPEGCKATTRTITMADLRAKHEYARNRLKIITDPDHKEYDPPFSTYFRKQVPSDPKIINEFALNTIIGNEMVDCWTKVFKGKMPLFDEWWRLYNCEGGKPCSTIEDFAHFAIPAYGAFKVVSGGVEKTRAPVNCILCAHIMFDNDVKEKIGTGTVTSFDEWLKINPIPRTSTSYLKFLLDGQSDVSALFGQYSYDITDEGLAILYERVNAHQLSQLPGFEDALTFFDKKVSEDLNYLRIVPYRQEAIVAPQGDCTFIID